MKKIAAVTMVRNDNFYLVKWVEYYGAQLGRGNLYVFFDGLDQQVPAFCEGVNCEVLEKIGSDVRSNDKGRVAVMSAKAAQLLQSYDLVIGTDADEFLVPDPALGMGLAEFLSSMPARGSMSGLGLDFGCREGEEGPVDESRPFLHQRSYALLDTRYTKASVLSKPMAWGSGFHRVRHGNFHIVKDLYLLHFGYFDPERIKERFSDPSRLEQGWQRHLKKRLRTSLLVSSLPARDFEEYCARARRIQTFARPPYAWNKPAMLGIKWVVKLPERFKDIV